MSAIVRQRDDFGPIQRNRSSSANEASKPTLTLQRRQTHVGTKPFNFSPSGGKFFFYIFFLLYILFSIYWFVLEKSFYFFIFDVNATFYCVYI